MKKKLFAIIGIGAVIAGIAAAVKYVLGEESFEEEEDLDDFEDEEPDVDCADEEEESSAAEVESDTESEPAQC